MKRKPGFTGILAVLPAPLAGAAEIEIHIEALIDGRDQLIIQGDTLQWHHLENAAVGRHEGRNDPTFVSTYLRGEKVLDRQAWVPTWPEAPPSWVSFEAYSSVFDGLNPTLPATELQVRLEFEAREPPRLVEQPTAENDYRIVVELSDPQESHAVHKVSILIDTVSPQFSRGEVTGEGMRNIVDPIAILTSLFFGGDLRCHDAADADDNGRIEITDAVGLLGFLFLGTLPPPPPFPSCGFDVATDDLGCEASPGCG